MHISWNYLDKRKAAVDAIESFDDMAFIIEHSDEEIAEVSGSMSGLRSPGMDGLPHAHDPKAGENHLINAIDEIDVIKERYRQAKEYMEWFVPAWDQLSEDEEYILELFHRGRRERATDLAADHFGIDRRSVYPKKKRALSHLQSLLYGKF